VLVQERQVSLSHFPVVLRPVQDGDPIEDINGQNSEVLTQVSIPPGLETNHLLRSGFRYWSDLYTHRQIEAILAALEEVNKLRASSAIKARLQLAILGACEMPAYLCRWERYHPKALEAIANHRYARATVVVETNLLSPTGRGTIPRRLEAASKAMSWMADNSIPSRTKHAHAIARRRTLTSGALIVTGSSERQLLKDGVVKLVLTDPPYHDDVQYGELARLFHSWMHQVCGIPSPSEASEAVPNRARGTDTKHYEQMVTDCLAESRRTLAKNGRLVFTYRNKNTEAWTALANSLRRAEFVVVGLATVSAENAVDHSKRNKETFLCDLVIECVPRPLKQENETQLAIRGQYDTLERQNLLAMGQALAEWVNADRPDDITVLYTKYLREMRGARAVIR
jgi:putative DNA methylase